jgi:hypothetical protein
MHDSPKKKIDTIARSAEIEGLLCCLVRVRKAEIDAQQENYKAVRKRLKDENATKQKGGD